LNGSGRFTSGKLIVKFSFWKKEEKETTAENIENPIVKIENE
jgi:hypothetical protein